jgi:multidrug efflux pump subunit AcrB
VKRLIAWFAGNPVAANLMMLAILGCGFFALAKSKRELFPEIKPYLVTVTVAYPGATPAEVEEGICIKIEEEVDGIEGVKRITSSSAENVGVVMVEFTDSTDMDVAMRDVKTKVDAISTFPPDAERPVVKDSKLLAPVLSIAVHGHADEMTLRRLGEKLKDELAAKKEISNVTLIDPKSFEIAVGTSAAKLDEYGITFDTVVTALRQGSVNLGAGSVKTEGGEILIRTDRQAYTGRDYGDIVLLTRPDGTRVKVSDVATVTDGFADHDTRNLFDGEPAVFVNVNRVGDQSVESVAQAAFDFIEERRASLPEGISLSVWKNWSAMYEGRRDLMISNGIQGGLLVLLTLALFMDFALAFWVLAGMVTAVIGTFAVMHLFGVSINMMSLFAFVLALGILVDDGIVIADNIHYHRNKLRKDGLESAVDGTWEVALPVLLSCLTTVAALLPMALLPGVMGQFASSIPLVVALALLVSLFEAYFILPAHLRHLRQGHAPKRRRFDPRRLWQFVQQSVSKGSDKFVEKIYSPLLLKTMRWRYLALMLGVFLLFVTVGCMFAGVIRFVFWSPVPGDNMMVFLTMPQGTPKEQTEAHLDRIQKAGEEVLADAEKQTGKPLRKHVSAVLGAHPTEAENNWARGGGIQSGGHLAEVNIELISVENGRPEKLKVTDLIDRWREKVGEIPDATELKFVSDISGAGAVVDIQLMGPDRGDLRRAADEVREVLTRETGVLDIRDSMMDGKRELKIDVKPEAESLGITRLELVRQVRQAFYGEEAKRLQRGRDDVKVYVRYPENERKSLADVENMYIRLHDGSEIPFSKVASVELGRGPASIERAERHRTVAVRADIDAANLDKSNEINQRLREQIVPGIVAKYENMTFSMEGEQAQQVETMGGLATGAIIALLLIYGMLALAFKSYAQPLIVMTAIPFGYIGAVWAHVVLGYDVGLLSMIGLLAMAGVAVNDALVLIDFINGARKSGQPVAKAVLDSGPRRFQAVLLTSLTTFAGLSTLIFQTSVQAQFLIPMAIALGFGVMFCTFTTLLLIPALYLILEDIKNAWRRFMGKPVEFDVERDLAIAAGEFGDEAAQALYADAVPVRDGSPSVPNADSDDESATREPPPSNSGGRNSGRFPPPGDPDQPVA